MHRQILAGSRKGILQYHHTTITSDAPLSSSRLSEALLLSKIILSQFSKLRRGEIIGDMVTDPINDFSSGCKS